MNKNIFAIVVTVLFILSIFAPLTIGIYKKSTNITYLQENELPNIILTGYWNPTGQMIAPFSNDTFLNPEGWIGGNWEERGYNIYSFFPNPGIYNGTFEIDYQKTWQDFWDITAQVKPIAIVSFGAGAGPWEIEYNARNLNLWGNDYEPPLQPTPCPPDDSVSVGYMRHSTLPIQEIEDAVNEQTPVNAWVDWEDNPGAFLCEYMAYLGMWYQSIHKNDESYPCKAAGFIHVNSDVLVENAMNATHVTIRETIKYMSCLKNPPEKPIITGKKFCKTGVKYNYTFNSIDPDDDDISYYINWGDGQIHKWIGTYESGENVVFNHSWNSIGLYKIKVIAKDTCGAISEWRTFNVIVTKNKVCSKFIFNRFFIRFKNL